MRKPAHEPSANGRDGTFARLGALPIPSRMNADVARVGRQALYAMKSPTTAPVSTPWRPLAYESAAGAIATLAELRDAPVLGINCSAGRDGHP